MTLRLQVAGITHRGTVRANNEDCIAVGFWVSQETMESARDFDHVLDQPLGCIVADGMGGHNDGERASLLVARSLARRLSTVGLTNVSASVRAVNAELFAQLREHPEWAGMGSTAVGLAAHEAKLAIFNVGDSRAYKVAQSGLMQLSVDDSLQPNWKAGSGAERNTQLLQCFGGRATFTDIEPHVVLEPCVAGSTYLLCCDGLYETLTEEQMMAQIGQDLQTSAEALLRAALEKKARDNVTVALVRVAE
ncbi:MAG TPA: PP2C family serine/threonine-protein phosphatase [Burkholderiales bacterium]|jgi:PPM family protein phosphatase|nr:PP2C family serine/threonine-protein phosphatase [Burkholderiales bacterium]